MKTSSAKTERIHIPNSITLSANDAADSCGLEMNDLGGERVSFSFFRNNRRIGLYALTRGEAKALAIWLIAHS